MFQMFSSNLICTWGVILFFCIDLFFLGLFQQSRIQSLLIGYTLCLLQKEKTQPYLYFVTASFFDLLITGRFGFSLCSMLPAFALKNFMHTHINTHTYRAHIAVFSFLVLINTVLTECFTQTQTFNFNYTILQYCGNMIVLLGCLTFWANGGQDNRR